MFIAAYDCRLSLSDLRHARLVSREWVRAAGLTVPSLRPRAFRPAALVELFPCLRELDLSEAVRDATPSGLAALGALSQLSRLTISRWR